MKRIRLPLLNAAASDLLLDGSIGVGFGIPLGKRFWFNVRGDVGAPWWIGKPAAIRRADPVAFA